VRYWEYAKETERSTDGRRPARNRLLDSVHRRRSRQWPKWVSKALPHADIYAGWSEVGIPGLRAKLAFRD